MQFSDTDPSRCSVFLMKSMKIRYEVKLLSIVVCALPVRDNVDVCLSERPGLYCMQYHIYIEYLCALYMCGCIRIHVDLWMVSCDNDIFFPCA